MPKSIRLVPPASGTSWTVIGGDVVVCKATGEETDGECSVFETTTPPGAGTPPHVHRREDEMFYVLDGEYEFQVAGQGTLKAGPGSFLIAPRDVPHCFRNVRARPAKLLVIVTPPGIEKFFEALSRLPTDAPPSPETLAELAQNYGVEILERVE